MAVVDVGQNMYSHLPSASLKLQEEMLVRDEKFYSNLSEKLKVCSLSNSSLKHPSNCENNLLTCQRKLEVLRGEMATRNM